MGQSTDAIIAFGFDLGEELPEAWREDNEFDFETLQERELGLKAPEKGESVDLIEAYSQYWKNLGEAKKSHPVELVYHCHVEWTMYFLAVNGTMRKAHRGSPVVLYPAQLTVDGSQIEALKQFCDRHKIPWQEPGWYLFSHWG